MKLCVLIFLSLFTVLNAANTKLSDQKALSLLDDKCSSCHNPKKSKGKFDFSQIKNFINDDNLEKWTEVLDQIESGEMPPEDEEQLDPEESKYLISFLKRSINTHIDKNSSGHSSGVQARRLTLTEYKNSLKNLFQINNLGTNAPCSELLEETFKDGFNNQSQNLAMSSYHLNAYLNTARKVLSNVILIGKRPESKTISFSPKDFKNVRWTTRRAPGSGKEYIDLVAPTHYEDIDNFSQFSRTGFYKISIKAQGVDRNYPYTEADVGIHKVDPIKLDIKIGSENFIYNLADDSKDYVLETWITKGSSIGFGLHTDGLKMVRNGNFKFYGNLPKKYPKLFPQIKEEVKKRKKPGERDLTARANAWTWKYWRGPRARIFNVKIEGPFFKTWPPEREQKLIGKVPTIESIESILKNFAGKAYRRPLKNSEIDKIINYTKSLVKELGVKRSIKEGMVMILSSAPFIYTNQKSTTDHYSFASKLSYALWSSSPDELLISLAQDKKIKDPKVVASQVKRMLHSQGNKSFISNFPNAWFELNQLGFMPPDPDLYHYFQRKELIVDMKNEVRAFFAHALANNLSILDFVKADYSFINQDLAKIYGVKGVKGSQLRKYTFKDGKRGGILGMGAFLTLTADTRETSPIHRGVWIKKNLLGNHPTPPPPGLEIEEPDVRGTKTIREALAKHTSQENCRTCHTKIDPYGWAFENFGPAGEWRDRYVKVIETDQGYKTKPTVKIDSSSNISKSIAYKNIIDFKKQIITREKQIVGSFVKKMITYINGAEPKAIHSPEIRRIIEESKKKDYRIIDTIILIFQSKCML